MTNENPDVAEWNRRPILHKIQDLIFEYYEYRINIISNHLERKHKEKEGWELVNMYDIELELYDHGLRGFKDPLKALFGSSAIPKYDPFEEYYKSLLPWEPSQEDFIKLLASYVVTDDPDWFELMFRKWLVRCVRQSLGLTPVNKQCFTLVGKQNDGKTSFLDNLVPIGLKNYYKKGFDFNSKDGKFSLIQNFLINLDELASFDKGELTNAFKAVLSESTVKFRLLFQNQETPFGRRSSFGASTNRFEFLTDETGNVRWLPFIVHKINHDGGGPLGYMSINIDRVWAQAFYLLNDPEFDEEMTFDEIKRQDILNRQFLRTTTEMEVIAKYFSVGSKGEKDCKFFTASEIEEYLRPKVSIRLHRNQIGKALQILGHHQESNYDPSRGYSCKGYFLKIL